MILFQYVDGRYTPVVICDWLVANGFFVAVGDDRFELTEKGSEAADLGFYEWNPPPKA